jgi:DNA-directed RNA polymerase specialized sigma24 family protein
MCRRARRPTVQQYPNVEAFTAFARDVEPKLRYSLVAACGPERGLDATEDALVFAWEHWEKVQAASNPAGFLYRIGRRRASRMRRPLPLFVETPVNDPDPTEPGLSPALAHLSKQQRTAVVLIDGFGYTHQEVADLVGVGRSTVQKHHERGLGKLRREMGVNVDV